MPAKSTPVLDEFVSREKFLAFGCQRRFDVIAVPGLGNVRIRSLNELERSRYESGNLDQDGELDEQQMLSSKRRLIALCVCDGAGAALLTEADVAALGEQDGAFTGLVFDRCWKHCGFSKQDIERVVGNLSGPPAVDSP